MLLFNLYSTNSLSIAGYRESAYKFSSHYEKFYIFTKITKFCLNYIIALFYTLILVLLH